MSAMAAVMLLTVLAAAAAPRPSVQMVPLPVRPTMAPVVACASLATLDLTGLPGAPTAVRSARLEHFGPGRTTQFCLVKGYVAPQVQFELHLPSRGYTGRYLQGGCGGACGVFWDSVIPTCDDQLAFNGEFAVAFEDSGHVGASPMDVVWAANDPELRVDFAYRAAHVTALAAKALITAYYGKPPAKSYFQGCSDGGREGLMEAERYPADFNGIIAGSPAIWITPGVVRFVWEIKITHDGDRQILTPEAVQLLHRAVLQACDRLDGVQDGQIDDPRACHFDPAALTCRAGQSPPQCLTPEQARVLRELYRGPTDKGGHFLYLGGEPYGSELTWLDAHGLINGGTLLLENQIKYMTFAGNPPADFDWKSLTFDEQKLHTLFQKAGFYDASDADLNDFRRRGGRLILWQGTADSPAGSYSLLDYYQRLRDAAGGLQAARKFARVFLVPAVYHCNGGYIPYEEDLLGTMVSWVEKDSAPQKVIATAVLSDGKPRTRPVFAYPVRARYQGKGSIDRASSFTGVVPARVPDDHFDWLGAHMRSGPPS